MKNLQAASVVVFGELCWVPGDILQAEDRVHRVGQSNAVNIYFLHVKNSVDDIIWNSVQTKLENVGQVSPLFPYHKQLMRFQPGFSMSL